MSDDNTNSANLPAPAPADTTPLQTVNDTAPKQAPAAQPGATPAVAADNDRIEQEWVIKTKQILLATRNDPFAQAQQLAALKADYMMKRYQKEIKIGD